MAFTISNTTCFSTYTLSSKSGTYDAANNLISLSVGADLTFSVQTLYGNKVIAMFYGFRNTFPNTSPNTILRSKDFDTGNALTSYTLNLGQVDNPGTNTNLIYWVPKVSFTSFTGTVYVGIPTVIPAPRNDGFFLYYYYDGESNSPDPGCNFPGRIGEEAFYPNINVDIPTALMTFTPPSGSNQFQFGPFLEIDAGTYLYTPVSWNDANYHNPPVGSIYNLGCFSGGLNAWTFQGQMTNSTSSTGYGYCTQLVRVLSSTEVPFAKTGYSIVKYSPSLMEDVFSTAAVKPKDASGNTQWGVDGAPISVSQFPWAYNTEAFTQFSANSGALAVPPANSIPDLNKTLQSFYADNPHSQIPILSFGVDTLIELNSNWQFVTHATWHPDGGIPISVAQYRWYLDCNEYNATADRTGLPADSAYTPTNWDLNKTYQTLGSNSFVPTYLQWFYNQNDYSGMVDPGIFRVRPKKAGGGGPNVAPMGSGPMGGAVTVPNFGNKALLPRGAGVNVGGMNSV